MCLYPLSKNNYSTEHFSTFNLRFSDMTIIHLSYNTNHCKSATMHESLIRRRFVLISYPWERYIASPRRKTCESFLPTAFSKTKSFKFVRQLTYCKDYVKVHRCHWTDAVHCFRIRSYCCPTHCSFWGAHTYKRQLRVEPACQRIIGVYVEVCCQRWWSSEDTRAHRPPTSPDCSWRDPDSADSLSNKGNHNQT